MTLPPPLSDPLPPSLDKLNKSVGKLSRGARRIPNSACHVMTCLYQGKEKKTRKLPKAMKLSEEIQTLPSLSGNAHVKTSLNVCVAMAEACLLM